MTAAAWASVASAAGGHVYWANISSNTIAEANLDGTHVDQSFITGANGPADVVVHGGHIYWANATGGCTEAGSCSGTIAEANLDGTGVKEELIPTDTPYGFTVAGQYIYWANSGTTTIGRAKLNGTDIDQSFITGANGPNGVAVDTANRKIYWANNGSNTIGEASLDGTHVNQSFITGPSGPEGMAIHGSTIYWVNHSDGSIGRASIDGTHVDEKFIAHAGAWPTRVTVTAQHIYWSTWTQNAVPTPGTIGEADLNGTHVDDNFIHSADSPVGVAVS